MNTHAHNFTIGDSVKVKDGILEPDSEAFSIGGWQGRIIEIREEPDVPTIIDIEWDSVTLQKMPQHFIDESEEEGLDWTCMGLYPEDLELTAARDTEDDVKAAQEELEDIHFYSYRWLGEQGDRIGKVLQGIDPQDDLGALQRWSIYLEQHLTFPFDAEIEEWQEQGPLQSGDQVSVKKISLVDDIYGIIVAIRRGREKFDCPLCELAALDESSPNAELLSDYRVWFANQ